MTRRVGGAHSFRKLAVDCISRGIKRGLFARSSKLRAPSPPDSPKHAARASAVTGPLVPHFTAPILRQGQPPYSTVPAEQEAPQRLH